MGILIPASKEASCLFTKHLLNNVVYSCWFVFLSHAYVQQILQQIVEYIVQFLIKTNG